MGKIKNWVTEKINQMKCEHEYEFVENLSYIKSNGHNCEKDRHFEVEADINLYRCKKCGKTKVKRDIVKEEKNY